MIDASALELRDAADGERSASRPCVTLALYSIVPLARLGGALVEAISKYLAFVPPRTIVAIYDPGDDPENDYEEGSFEEFDVAAERDLFRTLTGPLMQEYEFHDFILSGDEDGAPTGWGIRFHGSQLHQRDFPNQANLLRMNFAVPEGPAAVERLASFAANVMASFPVTSASCSIGIDHSLVDEPLVRPRVNALCHRYLGLDPTYDWMSAEMRDRVPPVGWLTLVPDRLLGRAGLPADWLQRLPERGATTLPSGTLLRAAARPPLGDVNRGATDIGMMPSLQAALRPVGFDSPDKLGMPDEDAGRDWLARLDGRTDQPWENW